ncbi:MAG: hypothetical protein M1817_003938 [Caeruleum heppii]|nr:MAG: hypothetical protein M1817_003938 [Caeruleum heppii]
MDAKSTSSSMHIPSSASFRTALSAFTSSPARFKVLHSVNGPTNSPPPRTLYVLDSSFNPPTLAHLRIATSAITEDKAIEPKKLLLLLATQNADKAPKPASFEHRLGLMTALAHDILSHLTSVPSKSPAPAIDIGVTTQPYFHDKASAISSFPPFAASDSTPSPTQVHLIGFDTLIRIFDPKYYPPSHTLDPIAPLLNQHRLRVTYRTDSEWGRDEEQKRYVDDIAQGKREQDGGKRDWAQRIDLVEGRTDGQDPISSTRVREAIQLSEMSALRKLVPHQVCEYVCSHRLYAEGE